MNIAILAISTLIVLIAFGIPIATHPQWFKTVEEEIEEAKMEGHIVTAKPVKVEHISKNRRDDIEEPHRYIVTYEYEYNGKTYAMRVALKPKHKGEHKMKNKKMLMVVAVAAAAMVMLAGCGKKDKTPSSTATSTVASESTEIEEATSEDATVETAEAASVTE